MPRDEQDAPSVTVVPSCRYLDAITSRLDLTLLPTKAPLTVVAAFIVVVPLRVVVPLFCSAPTLCVPATDWLPFTVDVLVLTELALRVVVVTVFADTALAETVPVMLALAPFNAPALLTLCPPHINVCVHRVESRHTTDSRTI